VTDAHEAFGQDVEEEAADKFLGIKDDGLFSISIFSILVAQGDQALLDVEDTVVDWPVCTGRPATGEACSSDAPP
jgi:hypothetical protein